MPPLEQLTQKIIKAIPSIMELKFGCNINAKYGDSIIGFTIISHFVDQERFVVFYDDDFGFQMDSIDEGDVVETFGRPIFLEDVLIALGEYSQVGSDGKIIKINTWNGASYSYVCDWLLNTPLHLQSPETVEALNKLIN